MPILKNNMIMWLYSSVFRPITTYVVIIQKPKINQRSSQEVLQKFKGLLVLLRPKKKIIRDICPRGFSGFHTTTHSHRNTSIYVFLDSQVTILALSAFTFASSLVWKYFLDLQKLVQCNKTSIERTLGHAGIADNEKADELARMCTAINVEPENRFWMRKKSPKDSNQPMRVLMSIEKLTYEENLKDQIQNQQHIL